MLMSGRIHRDTISVLVAIVLLAGIIAAILAYLTPIR
jgi:hypothetical protein